MTFLLWLLIAAAWIYNAYVLGNIAGHVLYIKEARKDLRK